MYQYQTLEFYPFSSACPSVITQKPASIQVAFKGCSSLWNMGVTLWSRDSPALSRPPVCPQLRVDPLWLHCLTNIPTTCGRLTICVAAVHDPLISLKTTENESGLPPVPQDPGLLGVEGVSRD